MKFVILNQLDHVKETIVQGWSNKFCDAAQSSIMGLISKRKFCVWETTCRLKELA